MKKNRIVITIWLSIIAIILISMIVYVIYAVKNNPYFGNNTVIYQSICDLFGGKL